MTNDEQPKRAVQFLDDQQLAHAQTLTKAQVLEFLEDFRLLFAAPLPQAGSSTAVSIRVPDDLRRAFRHKCDRDGVPYQSMVKTLMRRWLAGEA